MMMMNVKFQRDVSTKLLKAVLKLDFPFCPPGNCYAKVKEETTRLQEKIIEALGLSPVDKEVVVLYKGDEESASDDFHKVSRNLSI